MIPPHHGLIIVREYIKCDTSWGKFYKNATITSLPYSIMEMKKYIEELNKSKNSKLKTNKGKNKSTEFE